MSVIKLVNELIGKEDINWGDSSTTFTRETYTGGTDSFHFIDAEIIPATTLTGYIADYLHAQNTDTGTTSTTFIINSGGNSAILSTASLTADRTFTLPDGSNQALVGATDLASTNASKGASTVGVQDSGNHFSGATVEAVLAEIGVDVEALQGSTFNYGMKEGFVLGYSSTSAITISGGMWAHSGTTNQHVYMLTQATFTLGPAGSNASSDNVGANEVHYIYLHDLSIVAAGTRLLTATEFLNSTTAPSWSQSKVGWYKVDNGNDRCIGAVLTNGSSEISRFAVVGGHYYRYLNTKEEFSVAAAGTTFQALDISSSVPAFSTRARLKILAATDGTKYNFNTIGAADDTTDSCVAAAAAALMSIDIPLTTAQILYWYASAANNTTIDVAGYYIDEL